MIEGPYFKLIYDVNNHWTRDWKWEVYVPGQVGSDRKRIEYGFADTKWGAKRKARKAYTKWLKEQERRTVLPEFHPL